MKPVRLRNTKLVPAYAHEAPEPLYTVRHLLEEACREIMRKVVEDHVIPDRVRVEIDGRKS